MATLLQELLEDMSIIDQRLIDTVNGYVRQMETDFEVIPSIIAHLNLAFFCKPNEYFAVSGDNVTISNSMRTVEKIGGHSWDNTTYGNQWIDSTEKLVVKWEFKIEHNTLTGTGMVFALLSHDTRCNESCIQKADSPSYVYNIAGTLLLNSIHQRDKNKADIGCAGAAGDILTVVLDLIQRTISIIDKPKDSSTSTTKLLFEDVETGEDIKYKIGVMMIEVGTKITLNSMTCTN